MPLALIVSITMFISFVIFIYSIFKDRPTLGIFSLLISISCAITLGPYMHTVSYKTVKTIINPEHIKILKTDTDLNVVIITENVNIIKNYSTHIDYLNVDSNSVFYYDSHYNYYDDLIGERIIKVIY